MEEQEEINYGQDNSGLYVSEYDQDHVFIQDGQGEGGIFSKEDVQEYEGDIARLYDEKF